MNRMKCHATSTEITSPIEKNKRQTTHTYGTAHILLNAARKNTKYLKILNAMFEEY